MLNEAQFQEKMAELEAAHKEAVDNYFNPATSKGGRKEAKAAFYRIAGYIDGFLAAFGKTR